SNITKLPAKQIVNVDPSTRKVQWGKFFTLSDKIAQIDDPRCKPSTDDQAINVYNTNHNIIFGDDFDTLVDKYAKSKAKPNFGPKEARYRHLGDNINRKSFKHYKPSNTQNSHRLFKSAFNSKSNSNNELDNAHPVTINVRYFNSYIFPIFNNLQYYNPPKSNCGDFSFFNPNSNSKHFNHNPINTYKNTISINDNSHNLCVWCKKFFINNQGLAAHRLFCKLKPLDYTAPTKPSSNKRDKRTSNDNFSNQSSSNVPLNDKQTRKKTFSVADEFPKIKGDHITWPTEARLRFNKIRDKKRPSGTWE
ncbi:MAG: hypothetical protein MHPSP_004442, partial [Paramarteilia canceri]